MKEISKRMLNQESVGTSIKEMVQCTQVISKMGFGKVWDSLKMRNICT